MAKALRIFKKFLLYTLLTFLIVIGLAILATYFFQEKIIQLTFKEINKHLVTKIEVDPDVNLSVLEKFPQISIKINNVRIYENIPGSKDKLAYLKSLYFTFDAFDFLQGKYTINNIYGESGEIKIALDEHGYPNYNIFKTDTTTENNIALNLEKIILQEVMIHYANLAINQDHKVFIEKMSSRVKVQEKVWSIGLDGDVFVHKITVAGNDYFKDKAIQIKSEQEYYEETKLFVIHPSHLRIQGGLFALKGFYEGNKKNQIDLDLKAEKSTISALVSLLPESLAKEISIYKSTGNILFEASVKGFMTESESPNLTVDFGFENASFFHPDYKKKIENATLKGTFSNGKLKCKKTCLLKLENIEAGFEGKSFEGNFEIENFEDPRVKFNLHGGLDVETLIRFYPLDPINTATGFLDVNLSFSGRPSDLKSNEGKHQITASGNVLIKDLNVTLKDSPVSYKLVNGRVSFNKNDVEVNELSGKIGLSDFHLQGSFTNLITKLLFNEEAIGINAKLVSDNISMDQMMQFFASGPSDGASKNGGSYPYLSGYKVNLVYDVKHLTYKRMHAKNIAGSLEFNQPVAVIKNTTLELAGGKIKINTIVNFRSKDKIELNTKSNITAIHIDSVFYICENFNQDFLIDKNLKGKFTGDVRAFFSMDSEMDIHPSSVIATIDATISDGQLNNFEPMKKLSTFVDKKELANIRFSELKNKIYIENENIVIPEMEIKSNVSNISVLGTHTFNQHMDYKLTVPLKNFRRKPVKDKDEAFGAIEQDDRGNSVLFLTIKGTSDDYKIAYDTKRTGKKIKEGLRKERQEVEQLFKTKKPAESENSSNPDQYEFFEF